MRWQYAVKTYEEVPNSESLNEMGRLGWELTVIHGTGRSPHDLYIFKRPIQE